MKFCILIELSKKKISFLYNRSDGEGKFAPFVGDGSALPLAIYCFGNDIQIGQFAIDEAINQCPYAYTDVFQTMKTVGMYKYKGNEYHYNTLLKNAIEKYLTYFFDSVLIGQYGRLEQNIASMPICFVFNSDIDENERLFVKDCFEKGGYSNIATIDYDQIVVEASTFSTNYAVCVTSDGKDLFISLYETKTHKYLGSTVMPNRGKDPRVNIAVDKLWESLGYDNYYLNQEAERPILTKLAEELLSSGESEFQQNVLFTDGHARECFLSMRELDDYRYNDDGKIVADLKNMLKKQNISPMDCTIVMKGKAANSGFFKHVFNGEFDSLMNVNDSFHTKVISQLLKDIKDTNYRFNPVMQLNNDTFNSASISQEPEQPKTASASLKREVRGKIAEIKGKIRVGHNADAKALANELLNYLHEQNVDMWDEEIHSLLRKTAQHVDVKASATQKPQVKETVKQSEDIKQQAKEPEPKKEDPKRYQRDVRRQIAEAKASIRKGDIGAAETSMTTLKKAMNDKGISFFDNSIDEVLATICMSSQQVSTSMSSNDSTTIKPRTEAEKLLVKGRFVEAKRAFASEGNSAMAQLCSELIRSKRTVSLYQNELEKTKQSYNKSAARTAVRELTNILNTYKKYNINSTEIEVLINSFKTIK